MTDDVADASEQTDADGRRLPRRVVLGAAAWSVPVVAVASAAPAFAASGETLTRMAPSPGDGVFTADQFSTTQVMSASLTKGGAPVNGRSIRFTIVNAPSWLTFSQSGSAVATASTTGGVATVTLAYGTPAPTTPTSVTIQAEDPLDPALVVSWVLLFKPVPNAVVYRVGNGTATLANTGNAVFLDEFSPAGVSIASVALPTSASGANKALVASGTAASEGLLTNSPDGKFVVLAGYAPASIPNGASLAGTTGTAVPRTVGLVSGVLAASPTVDTSTALTDFSGGNNPRSAVTIDGTAIWAAGGAGGVRYATKGSSTSTQLTTTPTNFRQVDVANGQLYASSMSGAIVLATIGTGLPTTANQTVANAPLSPLPTGPYEYAFLKVAGTGSAPDTLYVADNSANLVRKYSLSGGTFTQVGTIAVATVAGIAAVSTARGVTLYITTATGLSSYVDTAASTAAPTGTLTTLATAGANTAFRGVAFSPVP